MNRVSLVGNVVRDLELKKFNDDKSAYVQFTLAVHDYSYSKAEKSATFINIVAFGKKAEILSQYTAKGRKLAVEGKIETGSYIDKDGVKKYIANIILQDFEFVDSKDKASNL